MHLCVQLSARAIQILTIRYFNGFAVFLGLPVERLHSFPKRDQLNKNHGDHVGVPNTKESLKFKFLLNWNVNMAAVTSCVNALLYTKYEEITT